MIPRAHWLGNRCHVPHHLSQWMGSKGVEENRAEEQERRRSTPPTVVGSDQLPRTAYKVPRNFRNWLLTMAIIEN